MFEDSMFNVDDNVEKSKSLNENLIMSNELDEDATKHDPIQFPNDDDISFSRLLFDSIVWQVQGSDNGNANLNMPIFGNFVQLSNAPP